MPTKWTHDCCFTLQPGKLTWNTTMEVGNMFFLFNWVTFRFHVHFRAAILLGHVKNTSRPPNPIILFKPIKSFDAGPGPRTSDPGHVAGMRPESSNLGGVNLNKDYPCSVVKLDHLSKVKIKNNIQFQYINQLMSIYIYILIKMQSPTFFKGEHRIHPDLNRQYL